jgi:hypothetical protein
MGQKFSKRRSNRIKNNSPKAIVSHAAKDIILRDLDNLQIYINELRVQIDESKIKQHSWEPVG